MKSSGRVTSISMAIKGEADIRQEDSMRELPNQLHASSNADNNLCAQVYRFCSLRNTKMFVGVSLVTLWVHGSYKTKAVQIQSQLQHHDIWLTISCVFTMLGASFRPKGTDYSSLNYSKCLLINSCWCWLRKGLSPRCKASGTSFPLRTLAAKTVTHFISLFLLGQATPQ